MRTDGAKCPSKLTGHIGPAAVASAREQRIGKKFRMLLNTSYSSPQGWILLAQDNGHLAHAGIELELTIGRGAYDAASRMQTQEFDLGYGDVNALIELIAGGASAPPVGILMLFDAPPSAIVVKRDGPIRTPADLRGKTLTGHAGDVALRTFGAFCIGAGFDRSCVICRSVEGDLRRQINAMLASDEIDGVLAYVSSVKAALAADGIDADEKLRFIKYADYVPELYGSCLMASERMLREEPAALAAIVLAANRGLRDVLRSGKAAIDAVARRNGDIVRGAEELRLATTFEIEMGGLARSSQDAGDVDDARLTRAIELVIEANGLPRTPRAAEVFTRHFLPPPAQRDFTSLCASSG